MENLREKNHSWRFQENWENESKYSYKWLWYCRESVIVNSYSFSNTFSYSLLFLNSLEKETDTLLLAYLYTFCRWGRYFASSDIFVRRSSSRRRTNISVIDFPCNSVFFSTSKSSVFFSIPFFFYTEKLRELFFSLPKDAISIYVSSL